jgi:aspartyl-tRNA synthetase
MYRDQSCGDLRAGDAGRRVTLAGWLHRRRDHGGLTFIDLRDRTGLVQVVANPESAPEAHRALAEARPEWVLRVVGEVRRRPAGMENAALQTGEIEVTAAEVEVLNVARTPPFPINEETDVEEMLRLRYRYLDLRREGMRRNLELRHRVARFIRDFLCERGFWEIETPMLFKTTPEGARDYLVPSRLYPGEFYALPQSPQQLKQLLMVAGVERYFQIARCFRDEDQRGDRQPEFTQLDIEMSFVEQQEVMALMEEMYTALVQEIVPHKRLQASPWPRLTYRAAMDRFGTDKPDLRYGLEIKDVSDLARGCGFKVFEQALVGGGTVRGLNARGCGSYSRAQIDELAAFVAPFGAKGLAYLAIPATGEVRSSFAKFLAEERLQALRGRLEAAPGDLLLFVADKAEIALEALGRLRELLAGRLGLADPDELAFAWIVDFPFVNWNAEEKRWDPSHHLFTAPVPEDAGLLDSDPGRAHGQQYDVVLNGYETAGGSIRIHRRELQEKVFSLIGLAPEVAQERFGHMLEAFEFGTPPHGGIASGLDRLCMVLAGAPNIREVIPFPKNQAGRDVMAGAPSPAEPEQLRELHLQIVRRE